MNSDVGITVVNAFQDHWFVMEQKNALTVVMKTQQCVGYESFKK